MTKNDVKTIIPHNFYSFITFLAIIIIVVNLEIVKTKKFLARRKFNKAYCIIVFIIKSKHKLQ